jgi:hypothetical protein
MNLQNYEEDYELIEEAYLCSHVLSTVLETLFLVELALVLQELLLLASFEALC